MSLDKNTEIACYSLAEFMQNKSTTFDIEGLRWRVDGWLQKYKYKSNRKYQRINIDID